MSFSCSVSAQAGVIPLAFPSWTDNEPKEQAVKLVTQTSPSGVQELKGPQALSCAADKHWAGTQGLPQTCMLGFALTTPLALVSVGAQTC